MKPDENIQKIVVEFTQHCECRKTKLFGRFSYDSDDLNNKPTLSVLTFYQSRNDQPSYFVEKKEIVSKLLLIINSTKSRSALEKIHQALKTWV